MKILEPNLMVLASAGSGKTYQLSNRILGFIAKGVAPETIVALTFTRKAAGEFTDEVLSKIATACLDAKSAERIQTDLQLEINFADVLEKLIRSLPRITLGTMDGFFSRVVKSFPHELGVAAGNFQLIEGAALKKIHEEMLAGILRDELSPEQSEKLPRTQEVRPRDQYDPRDRTKVRTYIQTIQRRNGRTHQVYRQDDQ